LEGEGAEFALDGSEGIVEGIHKNTSHDIDHQHMCAVLGLDEGRAATWRAGREIDRTQKPGRALDEYERLLLIPRMIAPSHRISRGMEKLVVERFGDAEAAGGVLAIDGDEVELPVGDQARQTFGHSRTSAAANDVADEENTHARQALRKSITSRSVSARSR